MKIDFVVQYPEVRRAELIGPNNNIGSKIRKSDLNLNIPKVWQQVGRYPVIPLSANLRENRNIAKAEKYQNLEFCDDSFKTPRYTRGGVQSRKEAVFIIVQFTLPGGSGLRNSYTV